MKYSVFFFYYSFLFISVFSCTENEITKSNALPQWIESRIQIIEQTDNMSDRVELGSELWQELAGNGQIPYVKNDTVVFFFKGNASIVEWKGDFNNWGRAEKLINNGRTIDGTDIWYLSSVFPIDSRFDYKIVINNDEWLLDPVNSSQQWGGAGPNSELRMPEWKESEWFSEPEKPGLIIDKLEIYSRNLGYKLQYLVYIPPNFNENSTYPVLYTTDGHEYFDIRLGALPRVADNLIKSNTVRPFIIIALDPRDPENNYENRRMNELTLNKNYALFLRDELIPKIENVYPVKSGRANRTILGTSLGGLFATFMLGEFNDVFGNYAIQSPAYWYKPEIFELINGSQLETSNIYMSSGTYFDGLESFEKMKSMLSKKNQTISFTTTNEGHSWGNWKNKIHEPIIYFYSN